MDKKDFKNQSGKEKVQTVFAIIILAAIFLFIVSQCGGGNSSYKSSTRGLIISY